MKPPSSVRPLYSSRTGGAASCGSANAPRVWSETTATSSPNRAHAISGNRPTGHASGVTAGCLSCSAGVLVVVRVDLRELLPLVRQLVLGEARVHGAGLDAGVAVDALVGVDVEHLDVVVIG